MENTYKKRIADGLLQRKLAGKGAQLIEKKYVERGEKDGSWRVFVTQ